MTTPGFTAEASVYKSTAHYMALAAPGAAGGPVTPAQYAAALRLRLDDDGPGGGADPECFACQISCCTGRGGANLCRGNFWRFLWCTWACCGLSGIFGSSSSSGSVIA